MEFGIILILWQTTNGLKSPTANRNFTQAEWKRFIGEIVPLVLNRI